MKRAPFALCAVSCVTRLTKECGSHGYILASLMEDAMTHTDAKSLYVLVFSVVATVISLSAIWYFTPANSYGSSHGDLYQVSNIPAGADSGRS
jgi:hypothetical protein